MELRDIEIFLTLAEELHFGRTAERLHVSQARVSQAIAKQERQIGAALFERTSRRVALTPIGTRLYADLGAGYRQITDALQTAADAARGATGALRLGIMGPIAHDIAQVTALFRARHPGCELSFREAHFSDPFGPLRAGDVDVQVTWLPVREPDLTVGPEVLVEPVALAVAVDHLFAGREYVELEDLGDCVLMQPTYSVPDYWLRTLRPERTPSGRPIRFGPRAGTIQEAFAAVAAGLCATPVFAPATRHYPRADIDFIPLRGAEHSHWALVWRTAHETELVRALARTAEDACPVPLTPGAYGPRAVPPAG
ncbi:LysR family transcriptional regulator [Streptomyces sp. NPDC051940]|uniref:LysR family transcriptional regulator n=1 Tax=Streptomyces sp. NPDC051940 TaxID=3155675 RepID=UPI00344212E9